MVQKAYPKRFARAVFEIALAANELDKWQTDLDKIAGLAGDNLLMTLLDSPKLSFTDKAKLLDERISGIRPLANNLANLLVAKGRMRLISGIAAAYRKLVDAYRGIQHAVVTTAIPLDEGERDKLEKALLTITGKTTVLELRVDPAILGGMVARIDGKLLDGSTRSKLLALKKELVGTENKI